MRLKIWNVASAREYDFTA